jgi:hypothetical protein
MTRGTTPGRVSLPVQFPGEMAELVEGAPLLREYGVKSSIEGSNPSLSAIKIRPRSEDPTGAV